MESKYESSRERSTRVDDILIMHDKFINELLTRVSRLEASSELSFRKESQRLAVEKYAEEMGLELPNEEKSSKRCSRTE